MHYINLSNDIYIPLAVIDDLDDIKQEEKVLVGVLEKYLEILENYTLTDLLKGVKINVSMKTIPDTTLNLQKNERPNIVKVHLIMQLLSVA
jgi:hypothetical protein